MTKKLLIIAALSMFCTSAMAQEDDDTDEDLSSDVSSSSSSSGAGLTLSTNNKFKISLMLGNSGMFNQELNYLTPKYSETELGIGNGAKAGQTVDPGAYLNFEGLGSNSLVNMAGIQISYYVTDDIEVNISGGLDLRKTPARNYVENEEFRDGYNIQGAKWVEGCLKNNWLVNIGGNYHFGTSNEKVDLYGGAVFGYQRGEITTTTPSYTRADYEYFYKDDKTKVAEAVYEPRKGNGRIQCLTADIVAGASYSLSEGLFIGLEFSLYSFRYSLLEVRPLDNKVYQADHFTNRVFSSPMLKFGFRF